MRRSTIGASLALAAWLLSAPGALAQQFTMRLSSPTINDVAHEWMKAFKAGVESRSGGKIKVELYPANQLGQIPATVEGVALGTIEFTVPAVGFLTSLDQRFQVLDAPGLFDSVEHGQRTLADPEVRKHLATFGAGKDVEPLVTFLNGPMMVVSHKPIRAAADFKGQKIRVPGAAPFYVEPFRKLGASPLSMPLGEVLPAMQTRVIDGVVAAFAVFTGFKYYDVAKAATYVPGSFALVSGVVNRGWMKSLGPDLEKIVREEAQKAEGLFTSFGVQDVERIRKEWEANRGEVIRLSDQETKVYLDQATSVIPGILSRDAKMKETYDILSAAAKRTRS